MTTPKMISQNEIAGFGKVQALSNIAVVTVNSEFKIKYINAIARNWLDLKDNDSKLNILPIEFQEKINLYLKSKPNKRMKEILIIDDLYRWDGISTHIDNEDCCLLVGYKLNKKNNASEINLNNVIEDFPELIYWKNNHFIYQGCNKNAAALLGYKSTSEIIGKSDIDLAKEFNWTDERLKNLLKTDQSIIQREITVTEEDTIHGYNNTKIYLTSKKPLYKNGKIVGILGISTDITDRVTLEKQLETAKISAEAANHAKTEFIANMSHDIRTPLTGVIGISDILEKLEANTELKQYAHDIHDCGQQLLAMLNSILDVVSADHVSEQDKVTETFNLTQCIEDVIQLEKPTMVVKNLNLKIEADPSIPNGLINDKTKIHRILLNLFSNAVKFTEKGSITLKTQLLSIQNNLATVRLAVIDTGIGIPEDQQQKVFDRFFRASPSYKEKYTGHGVGLHIAQSYAKALDTEIKLHSQEGAGTTFYIDITSAIPTVDTSHSEFQQTSNTLLNLSTSTSTAIEGKTCLLVEDNPIALKILESIVANAGLKYKSNTDGESALDTAKTHLFDFIITDIGLPKMSGNDFVEQYRQWETNQNKAPIPIFALTAHATQDEISTKSLQAGINAVFSKPFSSQALHTILTDYLQIKPIHGKQPQATHLKHSLGLDLPETEDALFLINHLAIFDSEKALSFLSNDVSILKDILKAMVNEELPQETKQLETAYLKKDWNTIENLAHKIKGGAIYVGAEQLKVACQYLERYKKAGHTDLLEKLYQQMMSVIEKTNQAISQYVQQHFEE